MMGSKSQAKSREASAPQPSQQPPMKPIPNFESRAPHAGFYGCTMPKMDLLPEEEWNGQASGQQMTDKPGDATAAASRTCPRGLLLMNTDGSSLPTAADVSDSKCARRRTNEACEALDLACSRLDYQDFVSSDMSECSRFRCLGEPMTGVNACWEQAWVFGRSHYSMKSDMTCSVPKILMKTSAPDCEIQNYDRHNRLRGCAAAADHAYGRLARAGAGIYMLESVDYEGRNYAILHIGERVADTLLGTSDARVFTCAAMLGAFGMRRDLGRSIEPNYCYYNCRDGSCCRNGRINEWLMRASVHQAAWECSRAVLVGGQYGLRRIMPEFAYLLYLLSFAAAIRRYVYSLQENDYSICDSGEDAHNYDWGCRALTNSLRCPDSVMKTRPVSDEPIRCMIVELCAARALDDDFPSAVTLERPIPANAFDAIGRMKNVTLILDRSNGFCANDYGWKLIDIWMTMLAPAANNSDAWNAGGMELVKPGVGMCSFVHAIKSGWQDTVLSRCQLLEFIDDVKLDRDNDFTDAEHGMRLLQLQLVVFEAELDGTHAPMETHDSGHMMLLDRDDGFRNQTAVVELGQIRLEVLNVVMSNSACSTCLAGTDARVMRMTEERDDARFRAGMDGSCHASEGDWIQVRLCRRNDYKHAWLGVVLDDVCVQSRDDRRAASPKLANALNCGTNNYAASYWKHAGPRRNQQRSQPFAPAVDLTAFCLGDVGSAITPVADDQLMRLVDGPNFGDRNAHDKALVFMSDCQPVAMMSQKTRVLLSDDCSLPPTPLDDYEVLLETSLEEDPIDEDWH